MTLRHRPVVLAMVFTIATSVLVGCASPRAALGPTQSPCFHAIPPATDAVGHQGRFAGIALTDVPARYGAPRPRRSRFTTTTVTLLPQPGETATTMPRRDVCLVAFRGSFDAARIRLLRGPSRSGSYAIAVVGVRTHRVLFVYLAQRRPPGFNRL